MAARPRPGGLDVGFGETTGASVVVVMSMLQPPSPSLAGGIGGVLAVVDHVQAPGAVGVDAVKLGQGAAASESRGRARKLVRNVERALLRAETLLVGITEYPADSITEIPQF